MEQDYVLISRAELEALKAKQAVSNPQQQQAVKDMVSDTSSVDEKNPAASASAVAIPRPLMKMNSAVAAMAGMAGNQVLKTRLVFEKSVASTGAGVFYAAWNLYTEAIALGEYTNFVSLFREFRIDGIRVHYIPLTPNKVEASINTNGRPITMAVDPQDASTPSSVIQVYANTTAVIGMTQAFMKLKWANRDRRWYSTASTTNPLQPALSLKFAGDVNLGTSITFGGIFVELFIEFRARL